MTDVSQAPDPYDEWRALARAYMPSRVFLTALELGVFTRLGKTRQTAAQLARLLKTDERATDILLNALATMGLLEKHGAEFANCDAMAAFLHASASGCQEGSLRHAAGAWDAWSGLTETVRTGCPPGQTWSQARSADLALAMQDQAEHSADKTAALLNCDDAETMLDLGGGPGSYAIAFVQRYPCLKAVLLDRDREALELARASIAARVLQDRITVREGDFLKDGLGEGYDLVFTSSVVCLLGEDENMTLLKRIFAALKEGGRLVVQDTIPDDTAPLPPSAALFAVNMLVNTPHGRVYTSGELQDWFTEAGFQGVHRLPTEPLQLVVGRR